MEEDRIQSGSLREHAEELETQTLSPYAMLSRNTRGREYAMEKCPIRTEFVRDRDRIIHCKFCADPRWATITARASRIRWRSARSHAPFRAGLG